MPIVLSIAQTSGSTWVAGPEGLFQVDGTELNVVAQPQQELACCAVTEERVLVGGAPHGIAFSLDDGADWQASWMDGVSGPVLCIAPDPQVAASGVMLAGSAEGGILRTQNRGQHWSVSNFGIQDFTALCITWAPVAPEGAWPAWEVVFAGTESGIYRSPNGGRGWQRAEGPADAVQAVAVSPAFHSDGIVMAGTEEEGLWRSDDGGRTFARVSDAPARIDAIVAAGEQWYLSDDNSLWKSADGQRWEEVADGSAALVLATTPESELLSGGEDGLHRIQV